MEEKVFGIPANTLAISMVSILIVVAVIIFFGAFRRFILVKMGTRNIPRRKGQSSLIVMGLMLSSIIIAVYLGIGDTVRYSVRSVVFDSAGNVDEVISGPGRQLFGDEYFDTTTIAFGLRNFTDKEKGLSEMHRCLANNGKLIILEFSRPTNEFFRELYDIFSFEVIPKIGEFVAQSEDSYRYLAESIRMHPTQEELKDLMESAGFSNCNFDDLTNGVVAIHSGKKGMVDV